MRKLLLSLVLTVMGVAWVSAQTSLTGSVVDQETKEPLIGANVALKKQGILTDGGVTDIDGNYNIKTDPGTYDVEVSYTGYATQLITGVVVKSGSVNKLNVNLSQGVLIDEIVIIEEKVKLVEVDKTSSGGTLTDKQIRNLPTRNINALAATTAGLSSSDEGGAISVRGSRDNATNYYVDGVRVQGKLVPETEIDQMQVVTGGLDAQYGDVTGGIISITTKGPSGKLSGSVEAETSTLFDPYQYNLLNANVSGPILRDKKKTPILGFRLSARYLSQRDDDPPATDIFVARPEVLQAIKDRPISTVPGTTTNYPTAEGLTNKDVIAQRYNPNENNTQLNLTGKLDARINKAIDIQLGGTYATEDDQFSPGRSRTLLHSERNPTQETRTYRANFRFRHRLGNDANKTTERLLIRNAQYILQGTYERNTDNLSDPIHGDNFFRYGHAGRFDFSWDPAFAFRQTPNGIEYIQIDNTRNFNGYTASQYNPLIANYNKGFEDIDNYNLLPAVNSEFRGPVTSAWGLHTNVGQVYNLYRKIDNDLITLQGTFSFDLTPGGSKNGTHSIQLGVLYEQRTNRLYQISPNALWNVARQLVNSPSVIIGLDTTNVVRWEKNNLPAGVDSVAVYGLIINNPNNGSFYRNARAANGGSIDNYFNIDGVDPDKLSLNMFTASEINDQFANLGANYYGFDYLGNRLGNDVTFDDFFRARDQNGNRYFPIAPFTPNYLAAYIQDKFVYKDIIFRVGLRMDRFDANRKVLKDPYSLYEIMSAKDFYATTGQVKPAGVGEDYKVYVNQDDPNQAIGFRTGDQWYNAQGAAVNDGRVVFQGKPVFPRYYSNRVNEIKSENFDPANSFEDYKPQVNWMPRLAFSFPIAEKANFFAHYDILVQRPPSNTNASPLTYYYMENNPGSDDAPQNNPNLRPERTIDYEVGFQQALGESSAIKLAAYYKELRDMIQRRTFLYVANPINTYVSYDNIDFGTVKGFTFQYDLRRTGNVTFSANYTLQFADGTGSDANSQRGLTNRGNNRILFPLNFDERHRLVANVDYRYDNGKKYNGPVLFGKNILADFGVNLQAIAVSGRPYTVKSLPLQFSGDGTVGQINGARKPWTFTLNLRVDKTFALVKGKNPVDLNVFFRVQNLLDTRNIINVYPATGSATDDGFLQSAIGQAGLDLIRSSRPDFFQAYLDAYSWRLQNPDLYTLPRRMYLGASIQF